MATTFARSLSHVKDDLPRLIQHYLLDCLAEHPDWRWRDRVLNPFNTVMLFVTQVLHGNTAMTHLRHLSGMKFTPTAYCRARKRLPLELLRQLSQRITHQLLTEWDDVSRWRGHRVWHGDGSSFSMPDTPALADHFGRPGAQVHGCGFPVATLMVLSNAAGLIVQTLALPLRCHEASQLTRVHDQLDEGDVLVYDRAGCSWTHLALLCGRHLHAILRMHQKQIVNFRPGRKHTSRQMQRQGHGQGRPSSRWIRRLGKHDQLTQWFKPRQRPRWIPRQQYDALPQSLVLRELRYAVHRPGFRSRSVTLVTTLTTPEQYPAAELAEQYLGRWEIEVNLRHLKTTMRMDVLKCRSVEGVLKELAVFVLVYNLVRLVMLRAGQRQKTPPDRISFIDALRWLCDARDGDALVGLIVNLKRPGRVEPRVIKRRMKEYALMRSPRLQLRQALLTARIIA